jgi:hypothetical protein
VTIQKLWASPPACLLTVLSISDLAPSNTTVSKKNVELLVNFVLLFLSFFHQSEKSEFVMTKTAEKKTKKKKNEGGESTKVKNTKKTRKSDPEKENLSVVSVSFYKAQIRCSINVHVQDVNR